MMDGSINLGHKMLPAKISYAVVSAKGIFLSVVINIPLPQLLQVCANYTMLPELGKVIYSFYLNKVPST